MSNIEIINPIHYSAWDELLLTNDQTTFFHTSAWARVLAESYNYKPLYFSSIDNDKLSALIPFMDIKSFLTGKRGVSLPFTDYCPPIVSDKTNFQEIIDELIEFGKKAGWKYLEWRGGEKYFQDKNPSSFYYGHTLDLTSDEKKIFGKFRSSTRRNIKRAVKEGVKIEVCCSLKSMGEFYRLNCITRKRHGLPPQPYFFLKKVHEHIISKKKGLIVLASHLNKTIAGAVYFHFGRKSLFKYGASNTDYLHLRPNNLVMWEAIKWYAQNGFKVFSFGRTEHENEGLLQFKRGWGTKEKTMRYYKYDFKKEGFIKGPFEWERFYNKIFSVTPIPVLKFFGSILYKHIG